MSNVWLRLMQEGTWCLRYAESRARVCDDDAPLPGPLFRRTTPTTTKNTIIIEKRKSCVACTYTHITPRFPALCLKIDHQSLKTATLSSSFKKTGGAGQGGGRRHQDGGRKPEAAGLFGGVQLGGHGQRHRAFLRCVLRVLVCIG